MVLEPGLLLEKKCTSVDYLCGAVCIIVRSRLHLRELQVDGDAPLVTLYKQRAMHTRLTSLCSLMRPAIIGVIGIYNNNNNIYI